MIGFTLRGGEGGGGEDEREEEMEEEKAEKKKNKKLVSIYKNAVLDYTALPLNKI
jgi:hypothetical protein